MTELRSLSQLFLHKYEEISSAFNRFQQEGQVLCPKDCGHCCFKHNIYCTPYELLPMAFHLLDSGLALDYLDRARTNAGEQRCVLLNIINEREDKGNCGHYLYRPFVCRAFGVSARHSKNNRVDFSVCALLKNDFEKVSDTSNVPFIDVWKKQFENLDPHLFEAEVPINNALVFVLEKVLLWDRFQNA